MSDWLFAMLKAAFWTAVWCLLTIGYILIFAGAMEWAGHGWR